MTFSKILLALAIAVGLVSASFAQTVAPAAEPVKAEEAAK